MNDKEILNFWNWFNDNCKSLNPSSPDMDLLNKLDQTILNWSLDWEIGPGKTKENSLTISPGADIQKSIIAKNIIAKSVNNENWEFYSVKQAKENWHLLQLKEDDILLDSSEWKYVLLQYEDGKKEVLIKAENLGAFEKRAKDQIIEIILINLLGEKIFMEKINFFEIVEEFENKNGTDIKYLPDHLQDETYFA